MGALLPLHGSLLSMTTLQNQEFLDPVAVAVPKFALSQPKRGLQRLTLTSAC